MKHLTIILVLCALGDFACSAHNHENEPGAKVKTPVSSQQSENEPIQETECEIPGSFTPSPHASVPNVSSEYDEVAVHSFDIAIELQNDGSMRTRVITEIKNSGATTATATVGYLLLKSLGRKSRFSEMAFSEQNPPSTEIRTCEKESPPQLARPFTSYSKWAKISLEPEKTERVEVSFVSRAEPTATPMTLFGYRDLFALNWNNWSWSYKKSAEFKKIADSLELYYGTIDLGEAEKTRISVRSSDSTGGLRGLSHEQNLQKQTGSNEYVWTFTEETRPKKVELEFSSGAVPTSREVKAFEEMVENRPEDMRAAIHLADLYLHEGALEKRLHVLDDILSKWDSNANEQLIKKRNDLLLPAYVALVKTLSALGLDERAKEAAVKGSKLAASRTDDGEEEPAERLSLAAKWLKRTANR